MRQTRIPYPWAFGPLLVAVAFCLGAAGSIVRAESAGIKATARVGPAGGMTELETIDPGSSVAGLVPERGSHLYWLYFAHQGSVQVQISDSNSRLAAWDSSTDLKFLSRNSYASLVQLERLIDRPGPDDLITITIVYPDN